MRVSPHLFGQDHDFRNNPVIPIAHVIHRNRNQGWFNRLSPMQQIKLVASAVYAAGYITNPVTETAIKSIMKFFDKGGVRTTVDKTYGLVDTFSKLSLRGSDSDTSEIAVNPKGDFETPVKRKERPQEPNMSGQQKRMRIGYDDEPMDNSEMAELRAVGSNSSKRQISNGETPLAKIPRSRLHPVDSTTQVRMFARYSGVVTVPIHGPYVATLQFRLNSIYDVKTSYSYNLENPTSDIARETTSGSIEVPAMRKYWATKYNYWSVVESRWNFNYRSNRIQAQNEAADEQIAIYHYKHGIQEPPTNQNTNTSGGYTEGGEIWDIYRRRHPTMINNMYIYENAHPSHGTYNNIQEKFKSYSYKFNPGDVPHQVQEDELKQTWHRMNEVPPTAEKMTIMFQRGPRNQFPGGGSSDHEVCYDIEVEFDVQLKDMKAELEYLEPSYDIPSISDYANQGTA